MAAALPAGHTAQSMNIAHLPVVSQGKLLMLATGAGNPSTLLFVCIVLFLDNNSLSDRLQGYVVVCSGCNQLEQEVSTGGNM